jgi:hypothetical protein
MPLQWSQERPAIIVMTEQTLRRRIEHYNAIKLLTGIVLLPGALVLWFLSFWVFRILIYGILDEFGIDAWGFSFYAALAMLPLLAWEGLRFNVPTMDVEDLSDLPLGDSLLSRGLLFCTTRGWITAHGALAFVFLVAKIVFAAPRATLQGVTALRSRIEAEPKLISQAIQAFQKLELEHRWMLTSEFAGLGGGLFLLDRLDMIWTKLENGVLAVRIPAGHRPSDFE